MSSAHLPVVLLLGAKSTGSPLASIPAELSSLKALLEARQTGIPPFAIQYEPYFTQEQLKTTLDQLAGRVAILHFAGHSDGGALLSDDKAVYAQHLATHISTWSRPPDLIFLNGCHNAAQVEGFHAAGVPVVIATHRAIDDGQAAGFAREFYAALLADGGQVALQAAFTRAGSKVLLSEARQARSLDIDTLRQDGEQAWDWGLFPHQLQQSEWTLRQLLTQERPRFDANGVLLNPYRGLEAFREEDRAYFFGREALTGELCDKIPATRLFALWGASGSGKSSLVSAGVIPRLRETGDWLILKTRPGNTPFGELASLFAAILHPDPQQAVERLQRRKALESAFREQQLSLPELLQEVWGSSGQARVLLCIDQFEELFTHSDPATVRAYESQLIRLVEADLKGCTLLLVMRADFLAAALANEGFTRLLNQHSTELLPPMGSAELRAAIEQPARKQRVSVEPALTEALLDAVENQPGSLPLLQYVLSLLWEQRDGDGLRLDTYNQFGGLEKALEIRANSILAGFSDPEQEQAKHIFLRLIQPGEGSADTRRRADLREFGDDPTARHILKALADARLITTQQDEHDRDAFAEVSHEALIRHWGKLREWIADNRDALRTQHQISKGAKDWEDGGRDAAWLLTGSRLAVAQEWLRGNVGRASVLEAEFIEASIHEQDRLAQEKKRTYKRNRNFVIGFICALLVALVSTLFFAKQAEQEKQSAIQQATNSAVQSLLVNAQQLWRGKQDLRIDTALLLTLQAAKLDGTNQNKFDIYRQMSEMLNDKETGFTPLNTNISSTFVGNKIWDFHDDGRLVIWDIATGNRKIQQVPELTKHHPSPFPDEKILNQNVEILVTLDQENNTLCFWDVKNESLIKFISIDQSRVKIAFFPDGTLVSFSEEGTLRFWNKDGSPLSQSIDSGQYIHLGNYIHDPHDIFRWGFLSNGKLVTIDTQNDTIRFWSSKGYALTKLIPVGHELQDENSWKVSPDDNLVTIDKEGNKMTFWDGIAPERTISLISSDSNIEFLSSNSLVLINKDDNSLRFYNKSDSTFENIKISGQVIDGWKIFPDGTLVTIDSKNNTLRFWYANGEPLGEIISTQQDIEEYNESIIQHENILITVDKKHNTLRFWNEQGQSLSDSIKVKLNISTYHLSPQGVLVIMDDQNGRLQFLSKDGALLSDVIEAEHRIDESKFLTNGVLVTQDRTKKTIRLWKENGEPLTGFLTDYDPELSSSDWMMTSDGNLSIRDGGLIFLRKDGVYLNAPVSTLQDDLSDAHFDFFNNGDFVTIKKNTLRFWNNKGRPISGLINSKQKITNALISSDNTLVTLDSINKTLQFWMKSGQPITKVLDMKEKPSNALAFPDGNLIIMDEEKNRLRFVSANGIFYDAVIELDYKLSSFGKDQLSSSGILVTLDNNNKELNFWNSAGELIANPKHQDQEIYEWMFMPNNKLLTVDVENNTFRLWDDKGNPITEIIPVKQNFGRWAFSSEGNLVTSDYDNSVFQFWSAEGKLLKEIHNKSETLLHNFTWHFSRDKFGILAIWDDRNPAMCMWSIKKQKQIMCYGDKKEIIWYQGNPFFLSYVFRPM